MKDVDHAIKEYRTRLGAQGELADSDLDELEDHLRELINELRTAGMSAADAVTEAARRLGDPRQLAREHARVRSQFGAPLSAGRALSGAVLFVVPIVLPVVEFGARHYGELEFSLRHCLVLAPFVVVAIALAARVTWARAVVLGVTMHALTVRLVIPLVLYPNLWIVSLGVFAFVMPWRRNEFSPAAICLALQAWACRSAMGALLLQFPGPDNALSLPSLCGTIALVCAAGACIGTVRRARWSAITSAISALALFTALGTLSIWSIDLGDASEQLFAFGAIGSGAIAAAVAAVLGWRTTRSLVGPLQRAMR